jgi:hypothetical protein
MKLHRHWPARLCLLCIADTTPLPAAAEATGDRLPGASGKTFPILRGGAGSQSQADYSEAVRRAGVGTQEGLPQYAGPGMQVMPFGVAAWAACCAVARGVL